MSEYGPNPTDRAVLARLAVLLYLHLAGMTNVAEADQVKAAIREGRVEIRVTLAPARVLQIVDGRVILSTPIEELITDEAPEEEPGPGPPILN